MRLSMGGYCAVSVGTKRRFEELVDEGRAEIDVSRQISCWGRG